MPASPKVVLGVNCPMLNVYDAVPQDRRINTTNQLTLRLCRGFAQRHKSNVIYILKGVLGHDTFLCIFSIISHTSTFIFPY